jgi:hypothetical protein
MTSATPETRSLTRRPLKTLVKPLARPADPASYGIHKFATLFGLVITLLGATYV